MANKVHMQAGGRSFTTLETATSIMSDASEKLWFRFLCSLGTCNSSVSYAGPPGDAAAAVATDGDVTASVSDMSCPDMALKSNPYSAKVQ